jgi:hypothetical protein
MLCGETADPYSAIYRQHTAPPYGLDTYQLTKAGVYTQTQRPLAVSSAVESGHKISDPDSSIFKSPTPTPSQKLNMYYMIMVNLLK